MQWYFQPLAHPDQADGNEENTSHGPVRMPAAVLAQHGARVLEPDDAADLYSGSDLPAPLSTVYRARTLLVPGDLMQQSDAINHALAPVGLRVAAPGPSDDGAPDQGTASRLPQTVVLAPADGPDRPAAADASDALRALRSAARSGAHDLSEEAIGRISLEHLLVGSAITGSPASGSGGGLTANPGDESNASGPSATSSYLFGGDARLPVDVCLDAPARRSLEDCTVRLGRRPVIAVLDTGVRDHPWLDVFTHPTAPGGYTTVYDGFVAVDMDIQAAIYARGLQARAAGDRHRSLIRYPWDGPVTSNPLLGELDAYTGHGHYIAGIVRQVVPDAQVLAIRVMHSDGIAYEGDLMCALSMLADRVANATRDNDMSQMVDALSLSLGYFSETEEDAHFSSRLWRVLNELTGMGVAVTAAAGNFTTGRRVYPAAFAARPAAAGHAPLISVGALNPNGTKALFSDEGSWVRAWATGAGLVSTYPQVNGSRSAPVSLPGGRSAFDPDDFSSGFAIWAGTSFSTPVIAAQIVKELAAGAAVDRQLRLDDLSPDATVNRAMRALKHLGWQG
jgi:subtilisin family serine protease